MCGRRYQFTSLVPYLGDTPVGGSEIRRSPVEVGSLSHYLQGFIHPRWLAGFYPSTVL